jgi:flavodoxin
MKVLVVYDSFFGNTEKVARAIAAAFGEDELQGVMRAADASAARLQEIDLLIIGSPTRQFNASPATMAFLQGLPAGALKGKRVAAFDTRLSLSDIGSGLGRFFVRTFGYADRPIVKRLIEKGGTLVGEPCGFLVKDSEGPLLDGELDRATAWAQGLK